MNIAEKVFIALNVRGFMKFIPDELCLKIMYHGFINQRLNLTSPSTYNEKLQWLKLYNRKPLYTKMVDKYEAKKYVSNIIGDEYIIPTFGVWDSFSDIDFNLLPNRFVLKCTHDSGGLVVCKDKALLDINKTKLKINKCLKRNYYWAGREWPYKDVKPRILAEQYLEDSDALELRDYKIYTFNGKSKMLLLTTGRIKGETKGNYYDTDFNKLDITWGFPQTDSYMEPPQNLQKMFELAERLSIGLPVLRVDFYEANGKVYFGELTFFDGSGFEEIMPKEWDEKMGSWIELK